MIRDQIRIWGTVFAALLGLAFGSFLNVCLSRWPEGESIVHPRSHCRKCGHVLAWWENIPLVSWIALRGRCRRCGTWIGWRYVIVEATVAATWAIAFWQCIPAEQNPMPMVYYLASGILTMVFIWFLVALAALDAENLWLPDRITLPGIVVGMAVTFSAFLMGVHLANPAGIQIASSRLGLYAPLLVSIASATAAAFIILLIRWLYWLVRRREGLGLGDAKLMALLAVWLGFNGAVLAFGIGVVLGALVALFLLLIPARQSGERWTLLRLPFGTFLCIGGIISALWGPGIIAAYLRWAGF